MALHIPLSVTWLKALDSADQGDEHAVKLTLVVCVLGLTRTALPPGLSRSQPDLACEGLSQLFTLPCLRAVLKREVFFAVLWQKQ